MPIQQICVFTNNYVRIAGAVESLNKVKISFTAKCKTHVKEESLQFVEVMKPDDIFLDMKNHIYIGPVVPIQCPKDLSNLTDLLCRLELEFGKL